MIGTAELCFLLVMTLIMTVEAESKEATSTADLSRIRHKQIFV